MAARDIFAVVSEAPTPADRRRSQLQLRQGSTVYCTLTIADGATISNVVDGFGLPPLAAGAQVSLDILCGAERGGYAAGARSDGDRSGYSRHADSES